MHQPTERKSRTLKMRYSCSQNHIMTAYKRINLREYCSMLNTDRLDILTVTVTTHAFTHTCMHTYMKWNVGGTSPLGERNDELTTCISIKFAIDMCEYELKGRSHEVSRRLYRSHEKHASIPVLNSKL